MSLEETRPLTVSESLFVCGVIIVVTMGYLAFGGR